LMDGGESGVKKFQYRHGVAWEYRGLQEVDGSRSSSSNAGPVGRGMSGAIPADRPQRRPDRR
jgi:hypothetical protein